MLTSQVITLAQSGELAQLAVRNNETTIMGFINLGMLELYKRFPLKQEEAIITLTLGKTRYTLDGTDTDVQMQSANNFLVISQCYDEDGDIVRINDESDPLGVMTPIYNVVEVPNIVQDEKLSVIYRTSPEFVTATTDNLLLPPQLLEALLLYVGFRGHGTISSDLKLENNTHYIRFEQSCQRVSTEGLVSPDDMQSYTFESRGFV